MQKSNVLAELDALLEKSDTDSSDWAEYEYEDGKALLAKLDAEDRAELFRLANVRPSNWRGCLVSILHPSNADEGEELIGALSDVDDRVVGEALLRLYFYCGFNNSATKGVYEDRRLRVDTFWTRVRFDRRVVQRIEQLSSEGQYLSAYWDAFAEAASTDEQRPLELR